MPLPATRRMRHLLVAWGAGALIAISAPAQASTPRSSALASEIADRADGLRAFYASREYRPLWLTADGRAGPAVDLLFQRVESAQFDGLDPDALRQVQTKSARRALRKASGGDADDVARADLELSRLFADYVRLSRAAPAAEMAYQDQALAPAVPSALQVLADAGRAASLESYLRDMRWMHPLYAPLRDAMIASGYSESQREEIWQTMARVRALPALAEGRHVLVDTAGARLWMYEDGEPVDSMRVVVGKPATQTPTMAGFLHQAIVNPYWNVPPDLVQQNIATNVLDRGLGYLRQSGYEVLSDYSDRPAVLDPKAIKWQAIADGSRFVRVRQKPGGGNFMGKVKFEFPNPLGIYLHDTPDKHLMKQEQRHFSAGCVRLEDADRFGRWLLGKPLPRIGKQAEQRVAVAAPVPIYIAHLPVIPTDTGLAFRPEVYGREVQLANTAY